MVWPYGYENWCNLEGSYLHFVADMSDMATIYGSYSATVCTVGVFGTKYSRPGDALPSSISIAQGTTTSLDVAHIVSDYTIGTTLAINLRQTTSLAFVTLTENGSDTSVLIDASEEEQGEY